MIVGIASILAYTSQTLKPMQDENVKNEKMQNILSTVGINVSREEAEKSYKKYIVEELALKIDGSINENINPFSDLNLAKELKKDYEDQHFPLYVAEINSEKYYIIELRGTGLWDAIWGYISLKSDFNTVNGVSFDHKGETASYFLRMIPPIVLFYVGENIKVIDGPFNGFNGNIEKVIEEKRKLEVMVKIFGRKTPLELSYMQGI